MSDVFISCTSENVSGALEAFIGDLIDQVRQRSILSTYYYRGPAGVGTDWQQSSGSALRRAKVFVPIYTPHFFRSEICEAEYAAFLARVQAAGDTIDCIAPIWWITPSGSLPPAVQNIVHSQNLVAPEDSSLDLEGIHADRNQAGSPYQRLLRDLAGVIATKAAAGATLAPGPEVDFSNGAALFGLRSPEQPAAAVAERVTRIHLVPMAGTKSEMELVTERAQSSYYGATAGDWNPYAGQAEHELMDVAIDVSRELRLRPIPSDHEIDLVPYIRQHEAGNVNSELVMIFVDPWARRVARLAAQLDSYDQQRFANTAVLVPVCAEDEETLRQLPSLLAQVLPRTGTDSAPALFQTELRDTDQFRAAFKRAVHKMRARTVALAPPTFSAQAGPPARMPSISGPVA